MKVFIVMERDEDELGNDRDEAISVHSTVRGANKRIKNLKVKPLCPGGSGNYIIETWNVRK